MCVHILHVSGLAAALLPALLCFVQVGRELDWRGRGCVLLVRLLLLQPLHHILGDGREHLQHRYHTQVSHRDSANRQHTTP